MTEVAANELERGARSGDPGAQYALARHILAEQPDEGLRAIALFDSAAASGHAEALAMVALFEAMGSARPQSWPNALDRLVEAAQAGSDHAGQQLRILSERGSGAAREDKDWEAIRRSIAIDRLLEPPPRQMLSDMPRILAFAHFASDSECEWIVGRAKGRLKRAKVFNDATGNQIDNPVRDNSAIEYQLPEMDVVLEVIRARIASATRLPVPIYEPLQVLHYAVGEQFRLHHDFLDPQMPGFTEHLRLYGQRIATMLVYLNDEYNGGETIFPKLGISYRGNKGDALFFTNVDRSGQGDPLTMHAGTPPTAGEKWVVSQWIRDRAPASPGPGNASGGLSG